MTLLALKTFIYLATNIYVYLYIIDIWGGFMNSKNNEEVALGITKLYVEEVARLGLKRKFDLDSVINAYLYTLARLNKKAEDMKVFERAAEEEIEEEKSETKKELLKQFA